MIKGPPVHEMAVRMRKEERKEKRVKGGEKEVFITSSKYRECWGSSSQGSFFLNSKIGQLLS